MSKNGEQARSWISQAERDMKAAKVLAEKEIFESACFMCQQSAEKALKGLLISKGRRGIVSHSVYELLMLAKKSAGMRNLPEAALNLDKHYVPPRYPDAFASGAPFQYYTAKEAKTCMEQAGSILAAHFLLRQKGAPLRLRRKAGSKKINRQLGMFIRRLAAKVQTHKVYLFGSFARGEQSEASDIDLLIVGDFKGNFLDRYPGVRRLSSLPIEPFCYTPQEIEQMKKNGNPLVKNMLKGRLLYSS